MGHRSEFTCEHCGYSAEVSGGEDTGMFCTVTTVSCEQCKELYDAVTSEYAQSDSEQRELKTYDLVCPKSREHDIKPWKQGDNCPVCDKPMNLEEPIGIWD